MHRLGRGGRRRRAEGGFLSCQSESRRNRQLTSSLVPLLYLSTGGYFCQPLLCRGCCRCLPPCLLINAQCYLPPALAPCICFPRLASRLNRWLLNGTISGMKAPRCRCRKRKKKKNTGRRDTTDKDGRMKREETKATERERESVWFRI